MDERARLELARQRGADENEDLTDLENGPSSEVRALENAGSRLLHVATRLRGAEAETSSLTVTDATGRVLYEGGLGSDGTVRLVLANLPERAVVRVLLETVRWHRQAEVVIVSAVTEHAFA
jgi:hypothetical protein